MVLKSLILGGKMAYTLYGSQTSPFVRRLRILLESIPYDFKELAIFEKTDAALLNKINPLNQVPVLVDGEKTIWDSRQIFTYLNKLHKFQDLNWEDENLLTAIEGAMGAGINLLLLQRSGFNTDDDKMFFNRQRERMESVVNHLIPYMTGAGLKEWNFQTASLYCFLEWANHRGIMKLHGKEACQKFLAAHKHRPIVESTKIPEGK